MSEWKEISLGAVANIDSGFAFKSKDYTEIGNLKVVRGKNVTVGTMRWGTNAKFWDYPTDGLERYFLEENDIVIGMDGSKIGENRSKIKEDDLPAILAQRVGRVRAKDGNSQEFLWQAINSENFVQYIKSIHTGTSIPHISQKQIGDFDIKLPPLPEQKAIAEVLSSLDDKIDLLHRQNKTLEQLAEMLFRQTFIEEAENDWTERPLKEIYEFEKGFEPGSKNYLEKKGIDTIRFKRVGDMLNPNAGVYISKKLANKECKINDLIMSFDGTVGKIAFGIKGAYSSGIRKIYSLYDIYNNLGLKFLLFSFKDTQDLIKSHSTGTVILHASSSINYLSFSFPAENMIKEFNNTINPIFDKILDNKIQIRTLDKMRDTLLPKLMSGEIRIVKTHGRASQRGSVSTR